ncbi:hypothetical protein NBO_7g0026 [Nosema bombycis CQ1]|uniref:Uncharacterized protein n=1 Tax=Nosema bombycis (strain CQ1 / CVCC 102059) TaxID=578461 RepID=R0MQN7_NOSB1|nr:hypothetical protein NBO_7g0026 [Nosema bombycis CQ1]|eukprot:EOB15208.1 hypothetical protein NBO_7g0026 [Nosema bombycis CQ1]
MNLLNSQEQIHISSLHLNKNKESYLLLDPLKFLLSSGIHLLMDLFVIFSVDPINL